MPSSSKILYIHYLFKMTTILDAIDSYVFEYRHVNRSFVRDVLLGKSNRESLQRWAVQKYHQVYEQNRTFSAIHSNSPYEDVRQFMVEQLIAEETALEAGSASHYELMKRFAISMGATPDEIRVSKPSEAVQRFLSFMMEMCRQPSFLDGMLPIYINESQAQESAGRLYVYLRDHYRLGDWELEWFVVHSEVDKDHSKRARDLMLKYSAYDQGFAERAMAIAKRACNEWLLLHDFYGSLLEGNLNQRSA